MAWSISSLFPSWGDAGEQPSSGKNYQGGDQVNEKHFDYLWASLNTLEDETRSALADIDSDKDGVVDQADDALLFKGNDIDSDGDGAVDQADGAPASLSDSGTQTITYPTDINFGSQLSVTDDGDGTATVDATATDTHTDVSDDGTVVVSDTGDINFADGLTATSDGDGTASVNTSSEEKALIAAGL